MSIMFPSLPLADCKVEYLLEFPIPNTYVNYHVSISPSFLLPFLCCLKISSSVFVKSETYETCLLVICRVVDVVDI